MSTFSGRFNGTSQNSLCNIAGLLIAFFNCALDNTFPALNKNSSAVHSRVGVTICGGLSGTCANSMVKLVLEPRRSNKPFAFIRIGSGLRSGVAMDITYVREDRFVIIQLFLCSPNKFNVLFDNQSES